jgi:predicted aspartyl protease
MGRVFQKALLQNSGDLFKNREGLISESDIKSLEVEFMVDTGAALICLPTEMIQKLGLQKQSSRNARTATGVVERNIYSPVKVTIRDRDANLDVMEIPGGIDVPPLLGYLALEALDLYVDAKGQKLIGNPATDGKMYIDLF